MNIHPLLEREKERYLLRWEGEEGMPRFHISPQTGEPVKCDAKISCPFDKLGPHYDTREEAREYWEMMMYERMFPSYDQGKINVKPLDSNMRVDDDTVVIPKGVYVVGDPSFTMGLDPKAWEDWVNQVAQEDGGFSRGAVGGTLNNYPVVALTMPLGPGTYSDNFNRPFDVNSGVCAAIPMSLLRKMGIDEETIMETSTIVTFDEAATLRSKDGRLHFGERLSLNGNKPVEEFYDDEEYET